MAEDTHAFLGEDCGEAIAAGSLHLHLHLHLHGGVALPGSASHGNAQRAGFQVAYSRVKVGR